MAYFIYILRCSDKSLYCGITTNIKKRVHEHNHSSLGAKYTRGRRPVQFVYSEKLLDKSAALKREFEIKKWPKKKKEALIKRDSILVKEL